VARDKDEKMATANRGNLRRVRRPKDKDALFSQLVQEDNVFETYADLMTFAATLGFLKDRRDSFEQSGEPINWEVFSNAGYESVVNAIAATSSGDLEILTSERLPERLAVFEEFANGGLAELQKEMRVGTKALDAVRNLMMEAQILADEKKAPDIQKIARDLSW
jgi:dnd system-associated protein 4